LEKGNCTLVPFPATTLLASSDARAIFDNVFTGETSKHQTIA